MAASRHAEPFQSLNGRAANQGNYHVFVLLQTSLVDRAKSANLGTSGQTTENKNRLPREIAGNQLNMKQSLEEKKRQLMAPAR